MGYPNNFYKKRAEKLQLVKAGKLSLKEFEKWEFTEKDYYDNLIGEERWWEPQFEFTFAPDYPNDPLKGFVSKAEKQRCLSR